MFYNAKPVNIARHDGYIISDKAMEVRMPHNELKWEILCQGSNPLPPTQQIHPFSSSFRPYG